MVETRYDVAFSFAGEQRSYVQTTYETLKRYGVPVFYDGGEVVALWGKDLYQYLSDIYSNQAKYCVIFLSRDYARKLWTKHELKSAQARAFQDSREYILPARFDDTEIPGLLPTIGYIDLNQYTPAQFADLIVEKVGRPNSSVVSGPVEVDRQLEVSLADAVIWAEEYLHPQPLDLSDSIAEAVRRSFRDAGLTPERRHLLPYIRNSRVAYRVVGYFAYQIQPPAGMVLDLVAALNAERVEANEHKETRPLWQLLVCFTYLVRHSANPLDKDLIRKALEEFLKFMEGDGSIDPGGECKGRIRMLLGYR